MNRATRLLLLSACATVPTQPPGAIARGQPSPHTASPQPPCPSPPARQPAPLEDMTATVRQWTLFAAKPTRMDLDADLAKRTTELNADAVVNVRYGDQGAGALSWSQISGTGQAIRYTDER